MDKLFALIVLSVVVVWGGEVMFSLGRIADALEKMAKDREKRK